MIVEGHGAFCIKCDKLFSKNNAIKTIQNTNVLKWSNRQIYNKEIEINTLKANACKNNGFNFEFWIYDNKFNKIIKTI